MMPATGLPADLPVLSELFRRFALALVLGLLVGIEREREKGGSFAGIRTFPLIAMLGCAAALINQFFAPWAFVAAFAIVTSLILAAYLGPQEAAGRPGMTTEAAALLTFVFGAMAWWELGTLAAGLTIVTTLLLALKTPLRTLTQKVDPRDIIATLEFGVITVIILPILPDRTFGPLDVLNPRKIWLMVVLIAGVNLFSYALIKMFGSRHGIGLAGLLGGLGSSTATTLGFSRRSRLSEGLSPLLALGVLIASSIMFVRILVIVLGVYPVLGRTVAYPLLIAAAAGFGGCAVVWRIARTRGENTNEKETLEVSNPFELWTALKFGMLFAVILFLSKGAQVWLGNQGVYVSSILAGIADVDAITLSLSNLARTTLTHQVAARGIVIAALSNTVVKATLVILLGRPRMARYSLPVFAAILVVGAVTILLI